MKIENPKEIVSVVRQQVFAVSNALSKADYSNGESPLNMHSHFSRFPVVIINKDKVPATGNIPKKDIADIIKRSDFAYYKDFEMTLDSASSNKESLSSGYVVQIPTLKGVTPASLLLEKGEAGKEILKQQYLILQSNLGKFPKNKLIMDAIEDAVTKFNDGNLKPVNVTSNSVNIYNANLRPLTRKSRADGKCFVYSINIDYHFTHDYPVEITISNFYAVVKKDAKGLLNVQVNTKDSEVVNKMKLTSSEWNNVLESIKANIRTFEDLIAKEMYNVAIEAEKHNKEEAKRSA